MAKLRYKLLDLETAAPFGISRWTNTVFRNFYLELLDDEGNVGRGEGASNARLQGPAAVEDFAAEQAAELPALRAALSAAAWDLAGKRAKQPVWRLLGLGLPEVQTSYTIAIDEPAAMIARARAAERFEVLKVKLGFDGDVELARTLAEALPEKRFRYDVNEGWERERAARSLDELGALGAELVEQPLPAADLEGQEWLHERSAVPLFADEALLDLEGLDEVYELYDGCVVKLEKAGGIASAFSLISAARGRGLQVLLGCMVSSSLGIAAGLQLAGLADFVDLDGALLLARDPFAGIEVDADVLRGSDEPGLGVEPVA